MWTRNAQDLSHIDLQNGVPQFIETPILEPETSNIAGTPRERSDSGRFSRAHGVHCRLVGAPLSVSGT